MPWRVNQSDFEWWSRSRRKQNVRQTMSYKSTCLLSYTSSQMSLLRYKFFFIARPPVLVFVCVCVVEPRNLLFWEKFVSISRLIATWVWSRIRCPIWLFRFLLYVLAGILVLIDYKLLLIWKVIPICLFELELENLLVSSATPTKNSLFLSFNPRQFYPFVCFIYFIQKSSLC